MQAESFRTFMSSNSTFSRRKAVFLDRDGVINVDHGYVSRIADFSFAPGAIDGMRFFQNAGYRLIVITNQSGIARGFYTERDYEVLTTHMEAELARAGVHLDGVYHCPHLPDAAVDVYRKDCDCRKPGPGLILRAVQDHGLDPSQSVLVGDKDSDIAAGRAAGVRTCYLVVPDPVAVNRESGSDGIFSSLRAVSDHLFSVA
jgi:D-glycero-D-manno-heptose 1,7-bisphosphate phosphatase